MESTVLKGILEQLSEMKSMQVQIMSSPAFAAPHGSPAGAAPASKGEDLALAEQIASGNIGASGLDTKGPELIKAESIVGGLSGAGASGFGLGTTRVSVRSRFHALIKPPPFAHTYGASCLCCVVERCKCCKKP